MNSRRSPNGSQFLKRYHLIDPWPRVVSIDRVVPLIPEVTIVFATAGGHAPMTQFNGQVGETVAAVNVDSTTDTLIPDITQCCRYTISWQEHRTTWFSNKICGDFADHITLVKREQCVQTLYSVPSDVSVDDQCRLSIGRCMCHAGRSRSFSPRIITPTACSGSDTWTSSIPITTEVFATI